LRPQFPLSVRRTLILSCFFLFLCQHLHSRFDFLFNLNLLPFPLITHHHLSGFLYLKANELIEILSSDDPDWWYGRSYLTSEEGWFPFSFGHVEDYSPSSLAYYQDHLLLNQLYSHLSPQQCQEEALRLYHDFLATEQSYQTSLQFFIANFIQTFSLRDSSFKRSFLNEYSIALSFTLIQEIYKSSAQLLSALPSLPPVSNKSSSISSLLKTSEIEQVALSIYDLIFDINDPKIFTPKSL
jgi:hypothetical protein